ncbi:(deoxy)nucleoside triphosphate pyrophosphohydrolase [Microbacterium sediminicola]|uniref:8-oxo-dGTP diphosphatase n=1 Tax=Microbacterium sediminicola TaxID=415210 RepID=A0ABN2IH16_9MICO
MQVVPTVEVVAAVIRDGERVLVCRRAPHIGQSGRWEFPGGKVEHEEDPVEALVREIREELDVDIRVTGHITTDDTHVGDRIIRLACYEAVLIGSHPTGSTDHDALEWLRENELDDRRWAEPDIPVIALLRARA